MTSTPREVDSATRELIDDCVARLRKGEPGGAFVSVL